MKYFNICTKKEFESNGQKKKKWLNCGTMRVTDDGKQYLELNMFPNTPFYVFEQKPKDEQRDPQGKAWDE